MTNRTNEEMTASYLDHRLVEFQNYIASLEKRISMLRIESTQFTVDDVLYEIQEEIERLEKLISEVKKMV